MMWEMAGLGAFPQFFEKNSRWGSAGIEEKRKEQFEVKTTGKKKLTEANELKPAYFGTTRFSRPRSAAATRAVNQ